MGNRQFSVACPIELPNSDKTIWITVGRAFESDNAKYVMKISLSAIPVTAFRGEPLDLFLFESQDQQHKKPYHRKGQGLAPPDDAPHPVDNVDF